MKIDIISLLFLLINSCMMNASSSSIQSNHIAQFDEGFTLRVMDLLRENDANIFSDGVEKVDHYFYNYGPFDIDTISVAEFRSLKQSTITTLGELLNAVASQTSVETLKKLKLDSSVAQVNAQIIIAHVTWARSQKTLYYDPAEMLRRLINDALNHENYAPGGKVSKLRNYGCWLLYHSDGN